MASSRLVETTICENEFVIDRQKVIITSILLFIRIFLMFLNKINTSVLNEFMKKKEY
jgi:hypothetical protein